MTKKIHSFIFFFLCIGTLIANKEIPFAINETTLSLYCKNMFYAADLDDQTTLFWGHQGIDHFPTFLEDKTVIDIIGLASSPKYKTAFTAILNDHTLFCWGDKKYGGLLPKKLIGKHVVSVISTGGAFAALLKDGSVEAWGHINHGGKAPLQLSKKPLPGHRVISLVSTKKAFLALLENGTVCSWGDPYHGGESPQLTNVVSVTANEFAFAAILKNGAVVSWCNLTANDYETPILKGDSVKTIVATDQMFSALLESGKIICWGFKSNQIVNPSLKPGEHAMNIAAHDHEFTACLDSGRILLWNGYDRDNTSLQTSISISKDVPILVSDTSFAMAFSNGTALAWRSVMNNEGTYGAIDPFSSSKDFIDIVPIPGGFCTLSKENKVSSLKWTTEDNSYLEKWDITPILPNKGNLVTLYAHFENYETKLFPIISSSDQLAILENPLSNQGQWEYQSENGWLPLPPLPDPERPNGFILHGDTKIRFIPTAEFDPKNIPGLTICIRSNE